MSYVLKIVFSEFQKLCYLQRSLLLVTVISWGLGKGAVRVSWHLRGGQDNVVEHGVNVLYAVAHVWRAGQCCGIHRVMLSSPSCGFRVVGLRSGSWHRNGPNPPTAPSSQPAFYIVLPPKGPLCPSGFLPSNQFPKGLCLSVCTSEGWGSNSSRPSLCFSPFQAPKMTFLTAEGRVEPPSPFLPTFYSSCLHFFLFSLAQVWATSPPASASSVPGSQKYESPWQLGLRFFKTHFPSD